MNEGLQEKALNMGKSIGQRILHADNESYELKKAKENAKDGRGYIIALRKARTLEQFLDEIIRIQTKFQLVVSSDILEQINSKNFIFVKQFAIISALNQLNCVSSKSLENKK